MEFSVNHPVLFVLVGIIIVAVLAQSFYFLFKAMRQAKKIGMSNQTVKKTILTSAVFTVAPAVSIVIAILSLSQSLGLPLPWLRLSVIGSLSYEAIAAQNAASGMGFNLSELAGDMNASQYLTISIVMTLSILVGIWLVPVLGKKIQNGLVSFEKKDKKWSDIMQNALFIGMISAFVGYVFCDFGTVFSGNTAGLIPPLVMAVSALVMLLCGLAVKLIKKSWISDYALPISLILGMASAIPITAWLG